MQLRYIFIIGTVRTVALAKPGCPKKISLNKIPLSPSFSDTCFNMKQCSAVVIRRMRVCGKIDAAMRMILRRRQQRFYSSNFFFVASSPFFNAAAVSSIVRDESKLKKKLLTRSRNHHLRSFFLYLDSFVGD